MKIEKIEKLYKDITKGNWYVDDEEDINGHLGIHVSDNAKLDKDWNCAARWIGDVAFNNGYRFKRENKANAKLMAAAPTITEQYIKARRFVVTKEFANRVHKLAAERMVELECPHGILMQAVIDEMWKEIEGIHPKNQLL